MQVTTSFSLVGSTSLTSMPMTICFFNNAMCCLSSGTMAPDFNYRHSIYNWSQRYISPELVKLIHNESIINMLIPLTIMGTAVANIINAEKNETRKQVKFSYGLALGFGLVHGLAFANNFKVMMFDESILMPLFLFNIGIEVGQLFIVLIFMFGLWLYDSLLNGAHLKWNLFVSGAGFGVACTLLLNTMAETTGY